MLWALGIFMVAMLFQVGKTANSGAVDKVDYATLQGWISSGVEVKGYIEHPPPNASVMCTITGYRVEGGKKKPFSFEDKLDEAQEKFLKENAGFQSRDKNTLLMGFLVNLLPILLIFLLIWFVLIRQIRSAGRGAMNFGKSKARMLNKEKNKITFKDVAGVDEACEEVSELVEFLKDPKKIPEARRQNPQGHPDGRRSGHRQDAVGQGHRRRGRGRLLQHQRLGLCGDVRRRRREPRARPVQPGARKTHTLRSSSSTRSTPSAAHRGARAWAAVNDEREQTLNALLVEMDGFDTQDGIIIIAATNRPDVLDPALLRPGRFDRQLTVNLPDVRGREDILKVHAKKVKLAKAVDLSIIARGTPGFSGAELANLLNEAALLAARTDKKAINLTELEEARDKVRWGRERRSMAMTDEDKKITAWHEAGHALVNVLLKKCHPLHKVTIIPRGQALGATMSLPKDDVLNRKARRCARRLP